MDSRLEALLVDALLRDEPSEQISSRAAAVGWQSQAGLSVIVGKAPQESDALFISNIRRQSIRFAADAVAGVQGDRLILLLGGAEDPAPAVAKVEPHFGDGPIVYAHHEGPIATAAGAATAAFSGYSAAPAWSQAPRPVNAEDLLPERALAGDDKAKQTLVSRIHGVLAEAGHSLLETVQAYVEGGHSLEATARELYVHTNTVRYRLKRVTEVTGWDPMEPRDAYVLQTALALGRL
ncbi:helix-turn-helix domain-containing protein [Nesterenkonia pannonica]|uniref:PucR family transcriptional regulator n=1 Tax=Nesterenkonia pannonica TaxID=1548602 RepID=UPI002164E72E|nr:helix-turn-helix domain-containing protein [Nesterenkonia pannonica]